MPPYRYRQCLRCKSASLGGELCREEGQLKVRAPAPLPEEVMSALKEHKASIMVALGVPPDAVVLSILEQIGPHLLEALRRLSDDKLLALVK